MVKYVTLLQNVLTEKGSDSDDEVDVSTKGNNLQKKNKRKFFKKKSIYSREYSSSSDENDDSGSDSGRVFFLVVEEQEEDKDKYDEEEGVVDLEGELISALSNLKLARKKNKLLKEEISKCKEGSHDSEET